MNYHAEIKIYLRMRHAMLTLINCYKPILNDHRQVFVPELALKLPELKEILILKCFQNKIRVTYHLHTIHSTQQLT